MAFKKFFSTTSLLIILFTCQGQRNLDFFIGEGMKNSPLLRDLTEQIKSNGTDSLLIKAINKPKADFRGYAYYAPVINDYGYSKVLTNVSNLTTVMSVSQPVFNRKTIEGNIRKTAIQGQSLVNTRKLTTQGLKKAITTSYLDALFTVNEISLNAELIAFSGDEKNILKSLADNGIYKQTDYLTFMLSLQELEIQMIELKVQFRKEVSDLYVLCGIKDTATFTPVQPILPAAGTFRKETSPLFFRFYIDSLRISNEHLLIDRNYRPAVSWFTDAGLINNEPKLIYQNFGLSFGLNFLLPVYDGNQRKLNHEKLNHEENIRITYAEAFNNEYNQQYRQLSAEMNQIRGLLPSVDSQVNEAKLIVGQEKELVYRGAGSITDYLIAMKNYLTVRKNSIQYQIRLLQIQNEINYLTNE